MDKVLGGKEEHVGFGTSSAKKYIAKKDFEIHHNDFHLVIKEGDDLRKSVPEMYRENLKTEGVI